MINETIRIALQVIEVLEDREIPYHVGGSFARSSARFPTAWPTTLHGTFS
jgi:hypothetical protein